MFSPTDLETAREKGQLRCQLDALSKISDHVERYGYFHSNGMGTYAGGVYLPRSRALPILRAIARNGWHVIWANKWDTDIPQTDGDEVHFVVGQSSDIGFWERPNTSCAYRIAPGPDGTIVESGPISPIPKDPRRAR